MDCRGGSRNKPMSRFAKIVILVVLFLGFMLLLTYISPSINQYAADLARTSHLPLWIVGLAAPILLLFKSLGNMLRSIFGESGTERRIRESNDDIKTRVAGIESDVRRLDQWRTAEIDTRFARISAWEQPLASLRTRTGELDDRIARDTDADAQSQGRLTELQNQVASLQATLAELRGSGVEEQ